MKLIRTFVVVTLVLGLASPALAQTQPPPSQPQSSLPAPSGKALIYSGAALFAGGMGMALYGFIRAGNGEFSTFGEATSRNKPLGAAGIAAAFAGGTLMFLGSRAGRYAPSSVVVSREGLAVEKMVSW